LLQIISEQEQFGSPVLGAELLEMIIRFYGGPMQALLSRYLEQAFTTMLQQQEAVQAQMAKALQTPFAPLAELARKNAEMWGFAGRGADDSKSPNRGDTKSQDDAKTRNQGKKGK
jgi:polyhydroxyalkanoate synthesis regulator protein